MAANTMTSAQAIAAMGAVLAKVDETFQLHSWREFITCTRYVDLTCIYDDHRTCMPHVAIRAYTTIAVHAAWSMLFTVPFQCRWRFEGRKGRTCPVMLGSNRSEGTPTISDPRAR